jgi:DNA polymerase-1
MKTITIIDTFGFLFRSYYALPPLKSKQGFPTGLLTGFMNLIANIGKDFQTDYLVFALDSKGDTFRHDIYKEYKSHRPDVPEDLLKQIPVAIEWIEKMGFHGVKKDGFEADDIIASLAHDAKQKGLKVRIVSHDKDLYQLIDDGNIFMFDPMKKRVVSREDCYEKYGVYPEQFTSYQSLLGDSVDNIPGVKGVGAKTASTLIQQFGSLENIYANIGVVEKPRWQKLLHEGKELAFISQQLVTLSHDAHVLPDDMDYIKLPADNPILKISDELLKHDMKSVIDRVHKNGMAYKTENSIDTLPKTQVEFESILLDSEARLLSIVNEIEDDEIIALDTETDSLDTKVAKIVGFSFCSNSSRSYYVPIAHNYLGVSQQISLEVAKKAIEILSTKKIVCQNFKYDYEVIRRNFGVSLTLFADTMILAWLIDSGSSVGIDTLAKKYFDHEMIAFKDTVKKGEDFSSVEIDDACKYASEDALITYKLYFSMTHELKSKGLTKLLEIADSLEYDFVYVLAYMEACGIGIDTEFFKSLEDSNQKYLSELTSKIHELAGGEFNINSTKQLGEVLFDKLELPVVKKTKTGYSTNEVVLQKLKDEHEIIPLLLEYRENYKLKSTYIKPLLELALKDANHKIYTSFIHTGTATGRLSSKNPNLQNIPTRSEQGRAIRKGFVASSGKKLVGIDYSQIELRLLAHFSKDPYLLEAFNSGLDIHMQTSIKLFGEDEAQDKRSIAKSINFGLIYGMGASKLAQTINVSKKEAKSYIDSYFDSFPTVTNHLKSIEEEAMSSGYIETLLSRRRYFDFESANGMQRAMYQREAVNSVFQGSAADIIKLAMVEIYKKYKDSCEVTMLLQIHDELIFEIDESKVDEISSDLKNIMEGVCKLNVPLTASVSVGDNWGDLK